ncbi:DUF6191 domain-containing protein [Streptomyces sp. NBC_01763]|uniref:DUF6191 domain-containing protein n=1 Tax=Streptomyces sp. NBC_01763 TaxID=2975934 RepID=UPI003FA35E59
MEFVVLMTLPGLVILLTVLAFADQLLLRAGRAGVLPWRNGARQGQISATGFEQLHASLSPGKQNELKERHSALLMRDDEEDGAPPNRTTVEREGPRSSGCRARLRTGTPTSTMEKRCTNRRPTAVRRRSPEPPLPASR